MKRKKVKGESFMYAVEIKNLTKKYKEIMAVNDLNMQVHEGTIYGLLGKNGAGKTTTIRIIMGLTKPDSGTISVFGKSIKKDRLWAMKNIGAIVETPGFYGNLTAKKNLKITADLRGVELKRVDEVLDFVGLSNAASKQVKHFSAGMRQRLGIANVLIHSPKILILDEPTNGLDPEGINQLRDFIQSIAKELKITVILLSHILSEVEQIANYIGIINNGTLVEQFNISELGFNKQNYVLLEVDKNSESQEILSKMQLKFQQMDNQFKIFCEKDTNGLISRQLVQNGITIYSMCSVKKSLEDKFLCAVGNKQGCE
ncbi:MAG: ABC transporter ATP-binding protein [Clostridia bacterium]|nr:ABC transporter ATP-binding protein [Clostridia bacterium]